MITHIHNAHPQFQQEVTAAKRTNMPITTFVKVSKPREQ
jgi:hypothetical protein